MLMHGSVFFTADLYTDLEKNYSTQNNIPENVSMDTYGNVYLFNRIIQLFNKLSEHSSVSYLALKELTCF